MTTFTISAIAADDLDRIRAQGVDDFGNALTVQTVADDGGVPLRCCLREGRPGEHVALIAHRPFTTTGPYAEVGPVFVHADPCDGWSGAGYPAGFQHRSQLLRAYDAAGRQVANVIAPPGGSEPVIDDLLSRADVDVVHSRNVLAGCWMFSARRSIAPGR